MALFLSLRIGSLNRIFRIYYESKSDHHHYTFCLKVCGLISRSWRMFKREYSHTSFVYCCAVFLRNVYLSKRIWVEKREYHFGMLFSFIVLGVVVLDSIYIHHSAGRSPNKSTNFFSSHFDGSLFSFFLLALLSGTLRTIQRAACDGEMLTLRCPLGTAVSIQLAQYGRPAPGISLCPSSSVDPSSNGHLNNDSCPLTPQMQVRKPTNIKSSQWIVYVHHVFSYIFKCIEGGEKNRVLDHILKLTSWERNLRPIVF